MHTCTQRNLFRWARENESSSFIWNTEKNGLFREHVFFFFMGFNELLIGRYLYGDTCLNHKGRNLLNFPAGWKTNSLLKNPQCKYAVNASFAGCQLYQRDLSQWGPGNLYEFTSKGCWNWTSPFENIVWFHRALSRAFPCRSHRLSYNA